MNDEQNGMLSGKIRVNSIEDNIYEVFYENPYKRIPRLEFSQQSISGRCETIEQRSDGFKIKGHDFYNVINWVARRIC